MAEEKKIPMFIVEDDEAWAAGLTGKLGKKFSINHFVSGEECVEQLAAIKPKMIVLDYHLEGQMTGLDTLKQIMKIHPKAYVIMFSAQDDVQTAIEILDNGAYDYVVKGENAFNRLKIIIRNIENAEALQTENLQLKIKIKRDKFWLYMVIVGILVGSFTVSLFTCPDARMIKWDPFNVKNSENCTTARPELPIIAPPSH